ncbi:transporter substrate-binding domain-containing protein [Marinomonas sp. MED121]|uniref:substrate-binding periplasmic protein n=1 Tax=Marinomonas sp. MED121 TaxID=314277 RepID=UPI00055A88F1|nr:transporter substrate-binding domain-containing protein [Marinomonas sp. MED121]
MKSNFFLTVILIFFPTVNGFSQTLKVATGEYSPTIGSNLKHGGYATHMMTLAFESQGISLDVDYMPWKRALVSTQKGDYDLSFYWFFSEERQKSFYYGDALIQSNIHFFHLETLNFDWQDYDDLEPYFVGLTAGYHYSPELDVLVNAGELNSHVTTRDIDNVNMLLASRIDIFPMTLLEGLYLINNRFPPESAQKITYHSRALSTPTGHPLFPKVNEQSHELLKIYNKGIKEIKAQGILQEYEQKMIEGWYEQAN